jgi:hypothetical protein
MPYLILADERELPYELLVQLAQVMDESPDIVLADAMRQLRTFHGILTIADQEEAERLAARFGALGVPSFLRSTLLEVPLPKLFPLLHPRLERAIELAAIGHLKLTTEHRQIVLNPLNTQLAGTIQFPTPGSSTETITATQYDTHFTIDLFTHDHHWRGQAQALVAVQAFLKGVDLSAARLGAGVRNLQAGGRRVPAFTDEQGYERYLSWLFQLRYARQD